jgi:hypothetical protein
MIEALPDLLVAPASFCRCLRQFCDMFTIGLRHLAAIVENVERAIARTSAKNPRIARIANSKLITTLGGFAMIQFAFLLAVIFGGIAVLTPIVGLTVYLIVRPWLNAYTARQNVLAAGDALERRDRP